MPSEPQLGIAYIALLEGDLPHARADFQEALAFYEQRNCKKRRETVLALLPMGDLSQEIEGNEDAATSFYERAFNLAIDLGFQKGVARALRSLGIVAACQQQFEVAARRFGACDAILEAINGKLPAFQAIGYDAALASTRSELGEGQFQRLWQDGGVVPVQASSKLV